GLNAGLVAGSDRSRLLRRAAVHQPRRARDLVERAVDVSRRQIDAREPGRLALVERERAPDHDVELLAVGGVRERPAALRVLRNVPLRLQRPGERLAEV